MTLILAATSQHSIWMVADRRLSNGTEDACKIFSLTTRDGQALLGYAGLGATALGTEPSMWMSAVLRGRNYTMEQSLRAIADAMKRQFRPHMQRFPANMHPAHHVIIPAFVDDEVRFYTIDFCLSPDRRKGYFRHVRQISKTPATEIAWTPRFGLAGSGLYSLVRDEAWQYQWRRHVLRLIRAFDSHRISPLTVADYLAYLNYKASDATADDSVGPRCMVVWENRQGGRHKGGGGNKTYTERERDEGCPGLPSNWNGRDVKAILDTMAATWGEALQQWEPPDPMPLYIPSAADFAHLPDSPDENLR